MFRKGRKYQKRIVISILVTLLLLLSVSNIHAITLVDNVINYEETKAEELNLSEEILREFNALTSQDENKEEEMEIFIKNLKEKYKGNYSFLVKNSLEGKTEIHIFSKETDKYINSFLFTNEHNLELHYVSEFEDEIDEYKKAGFVGVGLPNHTTNIGNHDWYIDQGDTGVHRINNCGPSTTAMVLNWINGKGSYSAITARNKIRSSGGWWYTDDIYGYLYENNVQVHYKNISSENTLKEVIDSGNMAILCINVSYLPYTSNTSVRINRFYNEGTGHFVVLTGYVESGDELYFEIYDPASHGKTVEGTNIPLGKARYIKSANLLKSAKVWWNYLIEVTNK